MPQQPIDDEIARAANVLRGRAAFPIESDKDLIDALGGKEARVHYGGRPYSVEKWARHVPRHYFPITSVDDFVTKARDADHQLTRIKTGKKGKRLDKRPK